MKHGRFERIVLADVRPPSAGLPSGVEFVHCDVRRPLVAQLPAGNPSWLFNFAAVHREPGHERGEYFDTNLPGARNACDYAEQTGCANILFTSSIATYGPTPRATSESSPLHPVSAYGISKLSAELVHEIWQRAGPGRRLLVCRPGVIYGPGDPGNILRMIRAVNRGYFLFPASKRLRKSYGYIEGLLDSFDFVMGRPERRLAYNYVERETLELGDLVRVVKQEFGKCGPTLTIPLPLLVAASSVVQVLTGGRSSIHPARVRKVATSTHIVPEFLINSGFEFRYGFPASLKHWRGESPGDF